MAEWPFRRPINGEKNINNRHLKEKEAEKKRKKKLRKKLNDDPSNPRIIKTIRGTGYMFIAEVETKDA